MITMTEDSSSAIDKCFELATDKLRQNDIGKREIIRDLSKDLEEAGMPKDMISAEITRRCREWVTPQYIRRCLGEECKQESKARLGNSVRKRIEDSSMPQPDVEKTERKLVQITAGSISTGDGAMAMELEQSSQSSSQPKDNPPTAADDHHPATTPKLIELERAKAIKDREELKVRIAELEHMLSQQRQQRELEQRYSATPGILEEIKLQIIMEAFSEQSRNRILTQPSYTLIGRHIEGNVYEAMRADDMTSLEG
jgi:hypothetical protein